MEISGTGESNSQDEVGGRTHILQDAWILFKEQRGTTERFYTGVGGGFLLRQGQSECREVSEALNKHPGQRGQGPRELYIKQRQH